MSKKKKIVIISTIVLFIIIGVVTILALKNNRSNKNDKVECEMFTGGSYNLKFETNGGDKIESMSICIACSLDSYEEIPTPTKEGDTFEGWYYDEKFEKEVTDTSTGNIEPKEDIDKNNCLIGYKDITLYAKWSTTEIEDTSDDETSKEDKEESSKTAYCEDGSKPSNGKCTSVKVVDANVSYTCGNLEKAPSGDKCIVNAVAATVGSCPANSTYSIIDDACIEKTNDDEETCTAKGGYIFPEGSMCTIEHPLTGNNQFTCEAGFELVGDTCYSFTPASPTYTCPEGTLNGTKCNITVVTDAKNR